MRMLFGFGLERLRGLIRDYEVYKNLQNAKHKGFRFDGLLGERVWCSGFGGTVVRVQVRLHNHRFEIMSLRVCMHVCMCV